jgi:transposase
MFVWHAGQFVELEVMDRQMGYGNVVYPVIEALGMRRQVAVQVAQDALAYADQSGHERDVRVLSAKAAAAGLATASPTPTAATITLGELQQLWALAGQGQSEKTAARLLHLLLAARHRNKALDVLGAAASLHRSAWEVLTAARLLYDYGALVYDNGRVPEPADTSLQAARASISLPPNPPDVARLVAFADALAKTIDGIAQR